MTSRAWGIRFRIAVLALCALAVSACSGGSGSAGNNGATGDNRAPVATTDTVESNGSSIVIPVLSNDSDADGDALSVIFVGTAAHGTATLDDAGTPGDTTDDYVVYTPDSGYTGTDSFNYTVSDGRDGRATGQVQILAVPFLVAQDQNVATAMNTSVVIDVLDHPATAIDSFTVPAFGTVTMNDNGTPADTTDDYLVYTPVTGYLGPDAFFYVVSGAVETDMAAVNVLVTASPAPPAAPNVRGQVAKGLIRDAQVKLYQIGPTGNRVGVPVAATTTDIEGHWALTLPASRPTLLVVASGGSFEDETRSTPSRTIELQSGDELIAVLPGSDNFLVSSIYTNALYLRAKHAAAGGGFDAAYAAARANSLAAWGFDIAATETANPALPNPVLPGAYRTHAMALGGAANGLDRIVTSLGLSAPNGATINALVRDLAECRLDGRDFDGVVRVNVDGSNLAIADGIDLNVEILRFRNNNFSAYSTTPLATWNPAACIVIDPPADTQPPTVSIDMRRTGDSNPGLSGPIDDPAAIIKVTIAGTTYDAINHGNYWQLDPGVITPALADGVYDVVVQAFDAAGNIGTDATTTELVIDSTAPAVTIDVISTGSGSPALSGTVDDPAATVSVNIDGNDYAAVVAGMTWSVPSGVISPALAEGNYAVTVTAVDTLTNTAIVTASSAVTVSVNDPPTFAISGDITVNENFMGARLVTVTPDPVPVDETGQVVTYSLNPAAGNFADVTIDANTGTVFITALTDAQGTQSFTILADDGQSVANFASQSFTLTVNAVNNPPAFNVSGDIVENQDFAGIRTVTATPLPVPPDEAGQTVVYSLVPASVGFANVSLEPATGTVSITAVPGATGAQLFTVTADDGQTVNNTASATFTLTVNSTATGNVVPVITGQLPLDTPEEVPLLLTLADFTVTDPDNSYPTDFMLSVQPGANYSAVGNTITPVTDFVGSLTVPVIVNDGASSSALYVTDVTVTAVNDAPAFTLSGNIVESEDFSGSRVVTVTPGPVPADETGQTVSYSLSPAGVSFANVVLDPAAGTVTVTAIANQSGSQVFTLTADDGQTVNNTAIRPFTLTVSGNSDPTTIGIADVDVLEDAAPVIVDLFAAFDDFEDADSDMTYVVVGNTNAGLFNSLVVDGVGGTLTLDFAANTTGTATLTVRATDIGGDWVETTFDVSVDAQADLRIATLAPSDAAPGVGLEVDFTIVLSNAGPSRATDVTVSVPLPAGYTYVTANNPGEYNEATGDWYRSAINGTATLVLTAIVNAAGPYDVTAEVVAVNEPDPDSTPGNGDPTEDDQRTTTTTPRPVTDLSLSISVDDPIPGPGDTVVVTVTVENLGLLDATGINVSMPPLPGQLTYIGASGAGSFDIGTGVWDGFGVAWSGDPMLPLSATLDVTARVPAVVPITTVLELVAEITAFDQVDPDGAEQDSVALIVLGDGLDHDWVGGAGPDPTDWHNPLNWSSGLVPSPGDNVVIGLTAFDPVLNADALTLATLNIESGAQVWANGFTISTVRDLDARDGPINGPGLVRLEFGQLRGTVPDLEVAVASPSAEADFGGDVTVNGDLTISQGRIDTHTHTITVSGDLLSVGTGILLQKEGGSEIIVAGDVTFAGGDYSQEFDNKFPLRDGILYVGGNFIQTGHAHSFAAENKHLVVFNGSGNQTIFMKDPDNSNTESGIPAQFGSRFANLRIDKDADVDGTVTLLSDVAVLKQLEETLAGVPRVTAAPGSGHVLTIGGADVDTPLYPQTESIIFDNVPLEIVHGANLDHMEGFVFTNMDPAVVQLRITRSAWDGSHELVDFAFESVPDFAAGGRYIVLDNVNADVTKNLTLDVLLSLPAYGVPMTEVKGNANILWGTGAEDSDRDGILDTDEYTSGTNPYLADSDGDGIDDATELGLGTDPRDSDSDSDGIGDGAELRAGGDPSSPALPGTVLYVRPFPLGDDANSGFGGWGDALATNTAVEATLQNGTPGQPFYVLYDAGVYGPLEIDSFDDVSVIGSMGPGIVVPVKMPTTLFDAGSTPDISVVRLISSRSIHLQAMTLTGASNFAGGGDGSLGGGLYVDDASEVIVADSIIENNTAADYGGGVYVTSGGTVELTGTLIRRNLVPAGGIGGGGIAVHGGLTMTRSIVADNRYVGGDNNGGGGGLYIEPDADPITISDSQILSNYSDTNGGGFFLLDINTPVTLFNNLIVGNATDADLGGALFGDKLDRGAVTLIESNTIAFNRALSDANSAGGIHIDRADDVQLRDNILWYNVDGDAIDELQDQFLDDGASALFEHNNFEDFGTADLFGNDDGDPHFEYGFYLRDDSRSLDAGSQTTIDAGLTLPYTTHIGGAEDTGIVDQGFHYLDNADGESYAAVLVGETAQCATDTLTLHFVIAGVGGDLGPGHVIAARTDGDDTAGGTLVSLTGIEPYDWSNAKLATDEGDGVYRIVIDGVSHAAGETAVYEIRADNDITLILRSTDLTTLFAGDGC